MRRDGFEGLADGALLVLVLLLATAAVVALPRSPAHDGSSGERYAEDLRLALFRTTLDGLGYADNGTFVAMANDSSIETYLRVEVHLWAHGPLRRDFSAANARVEETAARLLRPGWSCVLTGGEADGPTVLTLPAGAEAPPSRYESAWTYPALDGAGPDVRLSLAAWLNPR